MPKANLRVLHSLSGPFHKAECSVYGEKFYVLPEVMEFKEDLAKQFDAHLHNQHHRQWDATQKRTSGLPTRTGVHNRVNE